MASEVGGQQITVIGTVDPGSEQGRLIDDFFKNVFGQEQLNDPIQGGDGTQTYTTTSGTKVVAVESGFTAKTFKVDSDSPNVIVGGNSPVTKVVASGKVDNHILITDDVGRTVKAKGGNDDIVITGKGSNTVDAGKGNDHVVGGGGDDTIKGGTGNDTIEGGGGSDTLSGGTGSDTFVFKNAATGQDVIKDFTKKDILQIEDRTDDGKVLAGDDFTVSTSGGSTTITFKNGDTVTLKGVNQKEANKLFDDTDGDGFFQM